MLNLSKTIYELRQSVKSILTDLSHTGEFFFKTHSKHNNIQIKDDIDDIDVQHQNNSPTYNATYKLDPELTMVNVTVGRVFCSE